MDGLMFSRQLVVNHIENAFVTFARLGDEWSRGVLNGITDTAYLLDFITADEYKFVSESILEIIRNRSDS